MTGNNNAIPTDEMLATLIAQRDRSAQALQAANKAFAQLYQRHQEELHTCLLQNAHLLKPVPLQEREDLLEEVQQEVWVRVWQKLPKTSWKNERPLSNESPRYNFRAWLFRIARARLRAFRPDKRTPTRSIDLPLDNLPDTHFPPSEEVVLAEEKRAILKEIWSQGLRQLDSEMAALVSARLAGQTYEEITACLHLSLPQAYQLFHKAKQQLVKAVAKQLIERGLTDYLPGSRPPSQVIDLLAKHFAPRTRLLVKFVGRLHSIEGQTARVSLEDPKGEIFDAECAAADLTAIGIRPGKCFHCNVLEQGDGVRVIFEPWQSRRMPDKQWQRLRQQTRQALGEDEPTDDY